MEQQDSSEILINHIKTLKRINLKTNIACGVGWYNLIKNCLTFVNHTLETSASFIKAVTINRIKEKFGTLRIYYIICLEEGAENKTNYEMEHTHEIEEVIHTVFYYTEYLSAFQCEYCYKPGKITNINGWLKCVCQDCKYPSS